MAPFPELSGGFPLFLRAQTAENTGFRADPTEFRPKSAQTVPIAGQSRAEGYST